MLCNPNAVRIAGSRSVPANSRRVLTLCACDGVSLSFQALYKINGGAGVYDRFYGAVSEPLRNPYGSAECSSTFGEDDHTYGFVEAIDEVDDHSYGFPGGDHLEGVATAKSAAATGAAMSAAATGKAMAAAVGNGGSSRRSWSASDTVSTQPRGDRVTGRDLTTSDSGFAVIASDDVGALAALWKRLGKDAEVLLTRRFVAVASRRSTIPLGICKMKRAFVPSGLCSFRPVQHLETAIFWCALIRSSDPSPFRESTRHMDSRTMLQVAIEAGALRVAGMLLDQGADPLATDKWGKNALHFAAEAGSPLAVNLLCSLNVGVVKQLRQTVDDEGATPLHLAAAVADADSVAMVSSFLGDEQAEELLTVPNDVESTPLHVAAEHGLPEVVAAMIAACERSRSITTDAIVNLPNKYGNTALHCAARKGHVAVISVLLSAGADRQRDNDLLETAAELASKAGQHEAANTLLAGAVPFRRGSSKERLNPTC